VNNPSRVRDLHCRLPQSLRCFLSGFGVTSWSRRPHALFGFCNKLRVGRCTINQTVYSAVTSSPTICKSIFSLVKTGTFLSCKSRTKASVALSSRSTAMARFFCECCQTHTRFLPISRARQIAEVSRSTIYYWMDRQWVHWRELPSGRRVICEASLSRRGKRAFRTFTFPQAS
jgi:hypothetical protein